MDLETFQKSYKALFIIDRKEESSTLFPATIRKPIAQITSKITPAINSTEGQFEDSKLFKAYTKSQEIKEEVDTSLQRLAGQGKHKGREPKKINIVETPIIAELAKKYGEKQKMMKSLENSKSHYKPKDNLVNILGANMNNTRFPVYFGNSNIPINMNGFSEGPAKKKRKNKKPNNKEKGSKVVKPTFSQVYVAKT